jgi:colanic acid biosynthesis glycosyl transferase WcaI
VATVADPDSELARAVAEGGFGLNVLPGQSEELAMALSRMAAEPELRQLLRERTKWVRRFNPNFVLPQFSLHLENLILDTNRPPVVVGEREPSGV